MTGNDEFDHKRAAGYAWRWHSPSSAVPLPEPAPAVTAPQASAAPPAAPPSGVDEEEKQRSRNARRARAIDRAQALADRVDQLWGRHDEELLTPVTELLAEASEMGLSVAAMQDHPQQSMRLVRLAVRLWDDLDDDAREHTSQSMMWLDYSHPELVELMVELCSVHDETFITSLMMNVRSARWKALGRQPGVAARLARALDEADDDETRVMAARWLWSTGGVDAVPALRRALRRPHFVLLYVALRALDQHAPGAITPDDSVFVLESLIHHAPPSMKGRHFFVPDAIHGIPEMLADSIRRHRSPACIEPLRRVMDGQFVRNLGRRDLNQYWAWRLLAEVYPGTIVADIDRALEDGQPYRRRYATEAAIRLPDELAWPRLRKAAIDGVPDIAAAAEAAWMARRAQPCPVDTASLLTTLDAPASERLLGRLEVIRRGSDEARAAMAEVLLGEAPDREALALLLVAASDADLWGYGRRPGLPTSLEDLVATLIERFGPPAVEGVLTLATRYPRGRYGWMHVLARLAHRDLLPAATWPRLQALALDSLRQPTEESFDALDLLSVVGSPREAFGLLWSIASGPSWPDYVQHRAASALKRCAPGDADGDAQIEAEMRASLDDTPRFVRAALAGIERRQPAALAMALRFVAERAPQRVSSPGDVDALDECVSALHHAHHLPDGWDAAALAQPASAAFAIAARRMAWSRPSEPPGLTDALHAALDGDEPYGAAVAADTLLERDELPVTDERLPRIAQRAPASPRGNLLRTLLHLGAPIAPLWPLLASWAVSTDHREYESFHAHLTSILDAGFGPELGALRLQITSLMLRDSVDWKLGELPYWRDLPDEDEE